MKTNKPDYHHCSNNYWWKMPRIKDDIYAVIIGQNNRIIEVRTLPNREQAYKAKNKLLTKYRMFCYE